MQFAHTLEMMGLVSYILRQSRTRKDGSSLANPSQTHFPVELWFSVSTAMEIKAGLRGNSIRSQNDRRIRVHRVTVGRLSDDCKLPCRPRDIL